MNILNIQPIIPLAGGKIITRTIIPIVSIPDFSNETGKLSSGLADILLTAFYVPKSKGLMWGFGPVVEMPTGGSERGTQKWSAGPSFVALIQQEDWTIGALINNTWSFAGDANRDDVNHMLLNLFVVRQLGGGWYINSTPMLARAMMDAITIKIFFAEASSSFSRCIWLIIRSAFSFRVRRISILLAA